MTRNQLDYWSNREVQRNNVVVAAEAKRHNQAVEYETLRHNKATENLNEIVAKNNAWHNFENRLLAQKELQLAIDKFGLDKIVQQAAMKVSSTNAATNQYQAQTQRMNVLNQKTYQQGLLSNEANRLSEQRRSNLQSESISLSNLAETKRKNRANESLTRSSQILTSRSISNNEKIAAEEQRHHLALEKETQRTNKVRELQGFLGLLIPSPADAANNIARIGSNAMKLIG